METPEIEPEPQLPAIIEPGQRLSRSLLWGLQRYVFTRQVSVPHSITSSPSIASACARVVPGSLDDCQDRSPPL